MNPLTLSELLTTDEFQAGFGWGLIGLVLILLVSARKRPPVPLWGAATAAATLAAAHFVVGPSLALVLAVVALFTGGELLNRSRVAGWISIMVGAALMTTATGIDDDWWLLIGTFIFVVVGGWAVARVDRSLAHTGIPVAMLAGTVFGIWATVPDTELPRLLMGASAATILTGWPGRRASIGSGGAFAMAGLLAWAIGIGGDLRTASILGGWASIGVFSMALVSKVPSTTNPRWLFLLHAVSVFVSARVAGLQYSPFVALAIALPSLVVTMLLAKTIADDWKSPETTPSPDRSGSVGLR